MERATSGPGLEQMSDRRRQILELLKREGPLKAEALGQRLGITAMGVRQHLVALERDGLVRYTTAQGGLGRPSYVYELTEAGDELFPRGYAQLSRSLLEAARRAFGEEGLEKLFQERNATLLNQYRARLAGKPLAGKVAELARIRSEEGYMADWRALNEKAFLLAERNCAICQVARACPQACGFELALFREVLPEAEVARQEHLLQGDRRCTYLIRAREGAAT